MDSWTSSPALAPLRKNTRSNFDMSSRPGFSRRGFLLSALAGAAATRATAQQQSVSNAPTPRNWSGDQLVRYPDPDVVALDNRFRKYIVGNTVIQRLFTGTLWAEGVAWNGVGRYLVWSDIPNNRQMRWIEEDARVTVFRSPSGFSNGNTFDYQGRQLSCEHGGRRVARYESNGTVTTIADKFQGKRLNSPNDIAVHPDGGIWFTDPIYGIRGYYEGFKGESETKEAVYRVDGKTGQMDKVTDDLNEPNGICFSPDYKKVYICDTGTGREVRVYDIDSNNKLRNSTRFVQFAAGAADGIRCDIDGTLGCGWGGSEALNGVVVFAPDGTMIGRIALPERCANLCFGGRKRNRLMMAASRSIYSIYVNTQGVSGG